MFSQKEIWKEIRPDLPSWLDDDEKEELNRELGDFYVTTMLDLLGDGVSPVEGGGSFKKLSEEYADEEKGGDTNPNMELNGDMLSALTFEADAYGFKIGFWEESEAAKAYGHTTGFKGHKFLEGKAPQRKIIPNNKESFLSVFQEGASDIIEEFLSAREDSQTSSGA